MGVDSAAGAADGLSGTDGGAGSEDDGLLEGGSDGGELDAELLLGTGAWLELEVGWVG